MDGDRENARDEPVPAGAIGRVNVRTDEEAPVAEPVGAGGRELALKIGLGVLAVLIMIGALIVILQNVFRVVP